MTIENVNSLQPIISNAVENEVKEEIVKEVPQSKGSSKDLIAVLASFAAIGAAGVAIYKHRSAKKAIEKAEQEAKKKIEAAEEKAKKAAEDVENRIKEAIEKAKKELEESGGSKKPADAPKVPTGTEPKPTSGSPSGSDAPKPATPPASPVSPAGVEDKPSFFSRIKKLFKRKPKVIKPKAPKASQQQSSTIFQPVTPRIPGRKPVVTTKPEPSAVAEEENLSFKDRIKNLFTRKNKKPRRHQDDTDTQPSGISRPISTGIPIEENAGAKTPRILEGGILDTELEAVDENYIRRLKEGENGIIFVPRKTPYFVQKIKNLFKKKIKHTPETKAYVDNIERQLDGKGNIIPDIKEAPTPAEHDKMQAIYDLMLGKKAPEVSEVFKGIKMPDVTTVSEQNLLLEYNALKNIVKGLPAADPTAERFLAVQGELFNHRGYKFQNGELIKKVEPKVGKTPETERIVAEKEKELNGSISVYVPRKNTNYQHKQIQKQYDEMARELKNQEQQAEWKANTDALVKEKEQILNGKISVVDSLRKNNKRYHNKLQQMYEKIFGVKQVKTSDVRTLSEKKLFQEYNALKDTVKSLPVEDPTTQRFLEVQGELFNHRGYKFQNGVLVKRIPAKPELKPEVERTAELTQQEVVEEVEQNVTEKIAPFVLKTDTPKLLDVKPVDPQKLPAIRPAEQKFQPVPEQIAEPKPIVPETAKTLENTETAFIDELDETIQSQWQKNAQPIVAEKETQLNGKITVNVPKKPTNYEHNQLQKEYDALAIEPQKPRKKTFDDFAHEQEAEWQANARPIVAEKEAQLNGDITVNVSKKPTHYEHNQIQQEYEGLADELKESFNNDARAYVYNDIHHYGYKNGDKVTEYPKLYAPSEEKAAKKEMARLRKEHRQRRVDDYTKHGCVSDEETACSNSYAILPEQKYSYKKYKAMEKERPTEDDWKPEMTREEFMRNQEKYRWEEYNRTRHIDINDTVVQKPESLWQRFKKKIGF